MKKAVVIASALLITAGCTKKMTPKQEDADRTASKPSGITAAQLNEGKAMFQQKCTQCHSAKDPKSRDETAWRRIVPAMAAKAKKKGKQEISPADQERILNYLIAMSDAGK